MVTEFKQFRDNVPGDLDAGSMNLITGAINNLERSFEEIKSALDDASRPQLLVVASRKDQISVPSNGVQYQLGSWSAKLNNGWLNTSGAIQVPSDADGGKYYEIRCKILGSMVGGEQPRVKLTIQINGQEVAIAEDNLARQGLLRAVEDNAFRITLDAYTIHSLDPGNTITFWVQCWNPGSQGSLSIKADANTMITLHRIREVK